MTFLTIDGLPIPRNASVSGPATVYRDAMPMHTGPGPTVSQPRSPGYPYMLDDLLNGPPQGPTVSHPRFPRSSATVYPPESAPFNLNDLDMIPPGHGIPTGPGPTVSHPRFPRSSATVYPPESAPFNLNDLDMIPPGHGIPTGPGPTVSHPRSPDNSSMLDDLMFPRSSATMPRIPPPPQGPTRSRNRGLGGKSRRRRGKKAKRSRSMKAMRSRRR